MYSEKAKLINFFDVCYCVCSYSPVDRLSNIRGQHTGTTKADKINIRLLSIQIPVWEQLSFRSMEMSRLMRKPTIYIFKTKGADQLRSYCEADQHLCFRYTDSTISLLSKSKFLLWLDSLICVGPVRKPHHWFSHNSAQIKIWS